MTIEDADAIQIEFDLADARAESKRGKEKW